MSGGGNKKKVTKTQGWEEAGSEFYQESYPTDTEFDVLQKDAKHLATLLPSKQTRAAATTMRFRTNDSRTMRRQTSSRSRRESTVHRRTSTIGGGDVQVSMLPDLSENLSTEATTWDEIMLIKAMPIPMAQKKEMKAKILNEPNLRLQGYEQFKWKRRKMWRQIQIFLRESVLKLELWKNDLKQIEGHFGTGVVSYFLFLKWLFYLNLFVFTLTFLFIILPTIINNNNNDHLNSTYCREIINQQDTDFVTILLHLMQGTGFMECSILFYGYYTNQTIIYTDSDNNEYYYNLPLAYILITIICLIGSLIAIMKTAVKGFREHLIEGEGQFYQYCNLIFGGWDFCIDNAKTAKIKHKALYNEIKANLETQRLEELRQNRTKSERIKLILKRFIINLLVIIILICCGCAIYYIFVYSNEQLQQINNNEECRQDFEQLFYHYLPSIIIVCFNTIIPLVFYYLIKLENYTPWYEVRVQLLRTVFLRLSSLFVLYASLDKTLSNHKNLYQCNNNIDCWETYVGQQIYKLVLTDFFTQIFLIFFINLPRSLLDKYFNYIKFVKLIGEQTFNLPTHVLDVAYSQTLCWLGLFFAPLLSLICLIVFFLIFPLKRFQCLINSKPSIIIYRVSRSKSMFMIILLITLIFALLPIIYTITEIQPSINCGPYRNYDTIWSYMVDCFHKTPKFLRDCIFFLSTPGFSIAIIILLILFLYYYHAINSANRHMVMVLKNQLILEGHDKQFLLERLSKFIKHQENQKRLRHVELMHQQQQQQEGDTNIS